MASLVTFLAAFQIPCKIWVGGGRIFETFLFLNLTSEHSNLNMRGIQMSSMMNSSYLCLSKSSSLHFWLQYPTDSHSGHSVISPQPSLLQYYHHHHHQDVSQHLLGKAELAHLALELGLYSVHKWFSNYQGVSRLHRITLFYNLDVLLT